MTNKFYFFRDGNQSSIAPDQSTRCHRLVSLSLVSRQSVLPILLLFSMLFLGVGSVCGTDRTVTFEYSGTESITGNSYSNSYAFHRWTATSSDGSTVIYAGGKTSNASNDGAWGVRYGNTRTGEMIGNIDPSYDKNASWKNSIPSSVGAIPGKIKQIQVYFKTATSAGRGCYILVGTSQIYTDAIDPTSTPTGVVKSSKLTSSSTSTPATQSYNVSNTAYTYFGVVAGTSNYVGISEIVVTYEEASTCTPPTTALSLGASSTSITTEGSATLIPNGGNSNTITYTVTSANSSSATISGMTFSASATGTYTVQASQADKNGTCGGTATVNITVTNPIRTVNWVVNKEPWNSGVVAGNSSVTSGSKISVMPTAPTSSNCDNTKVFVGWTATENYSNETTPPTDLFSTLAGSPEITVNKTFYAVFANASNDFQRITSENLSILRDGDKVAIVCVKNAGALKTDGSVAEVPTETSNKITPNANIIWTIKGASSSWTIENSSNQKLGTSTIGTPNSNASKDIAINASYNNTWLIQNSTNNNNGFSGTDAIYISLTNSNTCALEINNSKWCVYNSSSASSNQYTALKFYRKIYTNYDTNCCQTLGTINGSVSETHQRSLTLEWDKLSGVDGTTPYTITCKQGSTDAGTIGDVDLSGSKATCTVTGLACSTTYTFTITAHGDATHCDKTQENIQGTTSDAMTLPALSYTTPLNAGGSNVTPSWASAVSHDGSVTYESSNPSVVQIIDASTGEAKPVGAGTATITATYAQSTNNCEASKISNTITVNGNVVVTFKLNGGTVAGDVEKTQEVPVSTNTTLTTIATLGYVAPSCKEFGGWAASEEDANAATPVVFKADGADINVSGATNLWAIWKTKTYSVAQGTGTATGCDGGSFTFSPATVDCDGTVTITSSPDATHKGDPSISILPVDAGTVVNNTITHVVKPITSISVSYAQKETATVILHDATGEHTQDGTRYEEDNYTLPPTAADCTESEFYGWYTEPYVDQATAPTGTKYIAKSGSKALAAGANHFYAVYATVEDRYTNTYTKITDVNDLTTGDYLIAGISSWCMGNEVSSNSMSESSMSSYLEDGVITNSSNDDIIWTITKDGDNYTLYNAAATGNNKYLALTTTSPAMQADPHNFTVALDGTCWVFSSVATTGYKLVYSGYFKSLTAKSSDVLLYKRDKAPSAGAPYTTSPSCTTHTLSSAVDPNSPAGGTVELGKTTILETKTTTAEASPSDHYTFSHWTISEGATMSHTVDGKSTDNPVTVTMVSADATITAHFTEKPKCTVEFYNNGGDALSSTTYWLGETPIAPTLTDGHDHDACDENSTAHYGWTQTAWQQTITKDDVDAKTAANVKVYTKGSTLPAIEAGDNGKTIKYYAVWAHAETTGSTVTKTYGFEDADDDSYWTISDAIDKTSGQGATGSYAGKIDTEDTYITFNDKVKVTNFSFKLKRTSNNSNYSAIIETSANGSNWSAAETYGLGGFGNGSYTSKSKDFDGETALYVRFHCDNTTAVRYVDDISITYNGTTTTYSAFLTNCCNQLEDINGEVEFTDPTTAVVTWDKLDNVAASNAYAVSYRTGEAAYGTTNVGAVDLTGSKATCTITGLSCNTSYDIKIAVTAATGYCDKEQVIEGQNSGKYTITSADGGNPTGGTFATLESACNGDNVGLLAEAATGYNFAGWTITKASSGTVSPAADEESTSFTMPAENVTVSAAFNAISYTITYENMDGATNHVSNPSSYTVEDAISLGDPTKEGFNFGGWFINSDLAAGHEAGSPAIAAGSTGSKIFYAKWIADDKWSVAITAPSHGTITVSWNGGVSSFSEGAQNIGKNTDITITATPSDGYQLTSLKIGDADFTSGSVHKLIASIVISATFTPITYTITYNNMEDATNHDDNPATYTIEDATITLGAPTKTGYTFDGWFTDNNVWENEVTTIANGSHENKVLYAKWTANQYTVTISKNYGTAATKDYTATFGAAMPDMSDFNQFTRAGYTLTGIFANNDGTGTKYYNADKSSAHVWDQAEDKTIYAAWSPKNYTITLNNEGADEGHEGTESISVTYDSNTNLTSAITKPEKTGYKFSGYFTEENGAGTQLIGEDRNVIASVSNYTSATKQWIKASDVELHAYWKACHTVTWSVNGTTTTEQVVSGEKVAAMHAAPGSSDCDDAKVFVGWCATAIVGTSVAEPSGIFTTVEGSPEITEDVTFYAVFADEDGGDFTRVTNTNQLEAGKKVLLGYEAVANSGEIVPVQSTTYNSSKSLLNTGTSTSASGSETIDMSTLASGEETNYAFTLRAGHNDGYWAFEMSGDYAGKYLGHKGKNMIDHLDAIGGDDKADFSITIGTNDVASIINKYGNENKTYADSKNINYMVLSYNYNNGNPRVAIYKEAQTGELVMYICNPLVYSNYVTTCASCDDDATFTTALPAVSAEDCTSATVTATGGLATLGSEGCNISDYGFVLSTATNPELDGEGVTKLQVGTSNPTVGNDFSYEMTGLTKGTHYYVRAYAINKHGVAYSSTKDFWTKDVSSIAITTAPTKTNYIVGEAFDATGMVVEATLAGGATVPVTEDVTFSDDALTAGASQNFAINYTLCETEVGVNQTINVYTLTVNEGTNDDKGEASYTSGATFSVSGLATHYTASFDVTNGEIQDNSNGTYTVINPTGNVTVTVNYVEALPVDVYYKVNGTTISSLSPEGLYQGETATLPTASQLSTEMSALSMTMSDYGNFVGWSETEFGYQTTEPTLASGTQTINADKTYYAVFTNLNKVRIDESVITSGSYPSQESTKQVGGINFKYHNILSQSGYLQLKWNGTPYGYIYNSDEIVNVLRIESADYNVSVYACTTAGATIGSAISAETREDMDPYVYILPANTSYFKLSAEKDVQCKPDYIDIYYAPEAVYYTTQFQTLTFNKADGNKDKDEIVAKNKVYELTADDAPAAVDDYTFLDKWLVGSETVAVGQGVTADADKTLNPISAYTATDDTDIDALPETVVDLVVKDGNVLNVNDVRSFDNLTVEAGGKVDLSSGNELTVDNFYIEGQDHKSGQVFNAENLHVDGDAYFDFTLAVSGETAANQWHNFSVPFPVDAMSGVYGWRNDQWEKLTNEVDYAIEDYKGDLRAQGKYGWKKYRGIMTPGTTYSMTVNGDIQTFRFKKTSGAYAFAAAPTVDFYQHAASGSGTVYDAGWNGLGNMRLCYASISNNAIKPYDGTDPSYTPGVRYVQILDASDYEYKSYAVGDINLTVGSAFFIQASADGTMGFNNAQNGAGKIYYAPARDRKQIDEPIAVTLSNETSSDRMYITASEDALNEYQIGRDLQKMIATAAPKAPMIYSVNYGGIKLAAEEAPIVDNKAVYDLKLYAPANGQYTISAPSMENVDLYLTQNGSIIWNLSMGAYELELTKGTTEGYGLLLQAKAPGAATGVDNIDASEAAQKVIINDHVYILRNGQMYDVNGKVVR